MGMKSWETLKKELLKDKEVAREYGKLAPKYELIADLIEARIKRGLTQEELAKEVGTTQSAISRFESGNANPTIDFVEKIASAVGAKVTIAV